MPYNAATLEAEPPRTPEEKARDTKLEKLAEIEGLTTDELVQNAMTDNVCPGICTNPFCDHTEQVESDQEEGYCEECDTNTVQSALILAGVI